MIHDCQSLENVDLDDAVVCEGSLEFDSSNLK